MHITRGGGGFGNLQCVLGECLAVEALKPKEIKGLPPSKRCFSTEVFFNWLGGFCFCFIFCCLFVSWIWNILKCAETSAHYAGGKDGIQEFTGFVLPSSLDKFECKNGGNSVYHTLHDLLEHGEWVFSILTLSQESLLPYSLSARTSKMQPVIFNQYLYI